MPHFKYDDDEERDYLDFGRAVRDRVVEADEAPDHRWVATTDPVTDPPVVEQVVVENHPDTPALAVQVDQTPVPSGLDDSAAEAATTPAESGQE